MKDKIVIMCCHNAVVSNYILTIYHANASSVDLNINVTWYSIEINQLKTILYDDISISPHKQVNKPMVFLRSIDATVI